MTVEKPGLFAHSNRVFVTGFYRTDDFNGALRTVLGRCIAGGADAGEVLATIAKIGEGDFQAWYDHWVALGDRVGRSADDSKSYGHRVSAAAAYLRASTYYDVALEAVDLIDAPDRLLPTFRLHRTAWEHFVDTTSWPAERVEIPFGEIPLPGYFFRPASGRTPRKTLVMNNGSDGTMTGLWCMGAGAALARGYNVLLFDGPGQQSMLFEKSVPFRPDWESVLTPVVDFLLKRSDVDAEKLAVYGVSQGGYWVPRALAFEHRFKAAVADPGVVDVSTSWLGHLPKNMLKLISEGKSKQFDLEMEIGMKFSKETARLWRFRARPFMRDGYFDTIQEVLKYRMLDLAGNIRTPLFITEPEDETFWPGQSRQLADLLPGQKRLVPFTAEEGANYHCQPLGRALTEQRMFDWLDELL